jgi:hypothetical protein
MPRRRESKFLSTSARRVPFGKTEIVRPSATQSLRPRPTHKRVPLWHAEDVSSIDDFPNAAAGRAPGELPGVRTERTCAGRELVLVKQRFRTSEWCSASSPVKANVSSRSVSEALRAPQAGIYLDTLPWGVVRGAIRSLVERGRGGLSNELAQRRPASSTRPARTGPPVGRLVGCIIDEDRGRSRVNRRSPRGVY